MSGLLVNAELELENIATYATYNSAFENDRHSESSLDEDVEDVAAQLLSKSQSLDLPPEYRVSTKTKLLYLGAYFILNLSLTIYNKAILGAFHFPWLLTAVHATCLTTGCSLLRIFGVFGVSHLEWRANLILVAYSFLFTANIAISNVSLSLVSVPFHQTLRSTTPACTVILCRILFSRTYTMGTYLSLVPIITGAAVATFGDFYFTSSGFFLTLLGVVLSSVKTITTNRLLVGDLKLPPLELLLRMSPLAALQSLLYAVLAGECNGFMNEFRQNQLTRALLLTVLGNGVLAFLLNVSSLKTNKAAGALTMAVAANTKQILTIVLGVVLFNVRVTVVNGAGMALALVGVAWYTKEELDQSSR